MKSKFAMVTGLTALLVATGLNSTTHAAEPSAINIAEQVSSKIKVFDGAKYTASQLNPNATHFIAYYSASWWPPCRQSVSQLVKQYNEIIAKNDKVELIMVSFDETVEEAAEWAKKESMPWPSLVGDDKNGSFLLKKPVQAVPTYRLYSKDGKVIAEGKKKVFEAINKI